MRLEVKKNVLVLPNIPLFSRSVILVEFIDSFFGVGDGLLLARVGSFIAGFNFGRLFLAPFSEDVS